MAKAKSNKKQYEGFSNDERAAMQERAKELVKESHRDKKRADGEKDVLAKIAEMPKHDRDIAKRIHTIVIESAPSLTPRTWYGMPAYSDKDGTVICFFQSANKFKARYATFGFGGKANLDRGSMWPVSYAITELTATEEAEIAKLVKKAVS